MYPMRRKLFLRQNGQGVRYPKGGGGGGRGGGGRAILHHNATTT